MNSAERILARYANRRKGNVNKKVGKRNLTIRDFDLDRFVSSIPLPDKSSMPQLKLPTNLHTPFWKIISDDGGYPENKDIPVSGNWNSDWQIPPPIEEEEEAEESKPTEDGPKYESPNLDRKCKIYEDFNLRMTPKRLQDTSSLLLQVPPVENNKDNKKDLSLDLNNQKLELDMDTSMKELNLEGMHLELPELDIFVDKEDIGWHILDVDWSEPEDTSDEAYDKRHAQMYDFDSLYQVRQQREKSEK